jgi:hypothetical protein
MTHFARCARQHARAREHCVDLQQRVHARTRADVVMLDIHHFARALSYPFLASRAHARACAGSTIDQVNSDTNRV